MTPRESTEKQSHFAPTAGQVCRALHYVFFYPFKVLVDLQRQPRRGRFAGLFTPQIVDVRIRTTADGHSSSRTRTIGQL